MNILFPNKFKYKNKHYYKNKVKKVYKTKMLIPTTGSLGIKILQNCRITSSQLEAIRKVIRRSIKKQGKIIFNIFPDMPVTKKASGIRMGRGKGDLSYWCAHVKIGTIIIELKNVNNEIAIKALKKSLTKLPCNAKIIKL